MKCHFDEQTHAKVKSNGVEYIYVGPKDKYFNIGERKISIEKIEAIIESASHLCHDIKTSTYPEFECHIKQLVDHDDTFSKSPFIDPGYQKPELIDKLEKENKSLAYLHACLTEYNGLYGDIKNNINDELCKELNDGIYNKFLCNYQFYSYDPLLKILSLMKKIGILLYYYIKGFT
ncbi:hypothetical protein [Wolbachia endosymbiont of Pentidionis agamae]|uniref:hypothetical protein n=1 Tax=Wolbachia endosymbiont of Pentidionis agamae TaxID=3110435 RepID=UPI002FD25814